VGMREDLVFPAVVKAVDPVSLLPLYTYV